MPAPLSSVPRSARVDGEPTAPPPPVRNFRALSARLEGVRQRDFRPQRVDAALSFFERQMARVLCRLIGFFREALQFQRLGAGHLGPDALAHPTIFHSWKQLQKLVDKVGNAAAAVRKELEHEKGDGGA
jgi:hypothetical protein